MGCRRQGCCCGSLANKYLLHPMGQLPAHTVTWTFGPVCFLPCFAYPEACDCLREGGAQAHALTLTLTT
jgi:hypothetical protein